MPHRERRPAPAWHPVEPRSRETWRPAPRSSCPTAAWWRRARCRGRPGLLFRRNSQSGAVEVLETDAQRWGSLNTTLHSNG
ncbi:MAG TPA: hypothetical protein VIP05_31990 [Burkholderiaceae bacterium]